jgi:hypothetical protein
MGKVKLLTIGRKWDAIKVATRSVAQISGQRRVPVSAYCSGVPQFGARATWPWCSEPRRT